MAAKPRSAEDAAALAQHFAKRPSKYRNVKTVVDGITFDSRKEAKRYGELKLLQSLGEITELEIQPSYILRCAQYIFNERTGEMDLIGSEMVGKYVADFAYKQNGAHVVEDVKGARTALYRWKKKHFETQNGIKILET